MTQLGGSGGQAGSNAARPPRRFWLVAFPGYGCTVGAMKAFSSRFGLFRAVRLVAAGLAVAVFASPLAVPAAANASPVPDDADVSALMQATPAERRFLNRVLDAATETALYEFDVDVTVADIVYGDATVRREVLKFGRQVCQRLNRNQRTGVTLTANFIFNEVTALIDWYAASESYEEGEIAFLSMIAFITVAEEAPRRNGLCPKQAKRGEQANARAQAAISNYLDAILG